MTDLSLLLAFARDVAAEAAGTARAATVNWRDAEQKAGPADWVTPIDREVELLVRRRVADAFPDHQVLGEEFGGASGPVGPRIDMTSALRQAGAPADDNEPPGSDASPGVVTWHVDPIDGTTNFLYGLNNPCVSIAAIRGETALIGVVADIFRGEIISAAHGLGVQVDGRPAALRTPTTLSGEVVLTEWSKHRPWPGMYAFLDWAASRDATVRIPGSCALALTAAGLGRAAVTILPGRYSSWDVAAGLVIARGAGLTVYDPQGLNDLPVPPDGLLVAAPSLAEIAWRAWLVAREAVT
jgi:myo-inositol-1(or 4)-monophosphatase